MPQSRSNAPHLSGAAARHLATLSDAKVCVDASGENVEPTWSQNQKQQEKTTAPEATKATAKTTRKTTTKATAKAAAIIN